MKILGGYTRLCMYLHAMSQLVSVANSVHNVHPLVFEACCGLSIDDAGMLTDTLPQHSSSLFQLRPGSKPSPLTPLTSTEENYDPNREQHILPVLPRPYPTGFLPPGSSRGFGNLPFSSAVTANHFLPSYQNAQLRVFRQPEWQILPCWTFDDSALGRIYTSFQYLPSRPPSRTLHTQDGFSLINVSFLFKDATPEGPSNPDAWASQVERTFTGQVSTTILLAGAYLLAVLMRWLTDPTPENYEALPLVIRPTTGQRLLPHPSSIDLVATVPMRDALLEHMREFLPSFIAAGVSVNWPRAVNDALIGVRHSSTDEFDEHEYFVSPEFAAHISDQRNWSFGRKILEEFPELVTSELVISEDEVVIDIDVYA